MFCVKERCFFEIMIRFTIEYGAILKKFCIIKMRLELNELAKQSIENMSHYQAIKMHDNDIAVFTIAKC